MAPAVGVPSFDEIIQTGRRRREKQQLANEIFGKNRRHSGATTTTRKPNHGPSLASRVGISKRSASSTVPSRPSSALAQHARTSRITTAFNGIDHNTPVQTSHLQNRQPAKGLSIKGTARPHVVQVSNFAPGTTISDIEKAVQTVALDDLGNSGLISCSILTSNPTVIAEIVLSEQAIALHLVEKFNNVLADNRILQAYLSPTSSAATVGREKKPEQPLVTEDPTPATKPRDLFDTVASKSEDVEMSIEVPQEQSQDMAGEDRRNLNQRQADPDVQDGRYGFANRQNWNEHRTHETGRPRDFRRLAEDKERSGVSNPDDRRADRGSYQRGSRDDDYRRDSRPSRFGNGFGASSNRGGNNYGRMYSDTMARGPPRGVRDDRPRDRY